MKKSILLLLISFLFLFSHSSQAKVGQIINVVTSSQSLQVSNLELDLSQDEYSELINRFNSINSTLNRNQRYLTYWIANRIANITNIEPVNITTISYLIETGLSDDDFGNVERVITFLSSYDHNIFTDYQKNQISALVVSKKEPLAALIKFAGYLQINSINYFLLRIIADNDYSESVIWNAHIALARIGNDESLMFCLNSIKKTGINDLVAFHLLPDLIYINQREMVDFLLYQVLEDNYNCSSPNPESDVPILCAYRIMEALAPIIVDFPFEVDESGDLLVDDYEEALVLCREWISININNYLLVQ